MPSNEQQIDDTVRDLYSRFSRRPETDEDCRAFLSEIYDSLRGNLIMPQRSAYHGRKPTYNEEYGYARDIIRRTFRYLGADRLYALVWQEYRNEVGLEDENDFQRFLEESRKEAARTPKPTLDDYRMFLVYCGWIDSKAVSRKVASEDQVRKVAQLIYSDPERLRRAVARKFFSTQRDLPLR